MAWWRHSPSTGKMDPGSNIFVPYHHLLWTLLLHAPTTLMVLHAVTGISPLPPGSTPPGSTPPGSTATAPPLRYHFRHARPLQIIHEWEGLHFDSCLWKEYCRSPPTWMLDAITHMYSQCSTQAQAWPAIFHGTTCNNISCVSIMLQWAILSNISTMLQ